MDDSSTFDPEQRRTKLYVQLLTREERRLNAFILTLVPNRADAEEVAQEVKIRLWQQFDSYDPTKDFGAWARTIAYYQVLSLRNSKAWRHPHLGEDFLAAVADELSGDGELEDRRHAALQDCLGKLEAAQRELLIRCYSGHESLRDAADRMGRSLESVRKQLYRLRTSLARCIEEKLVREDR